jgi:hypothetical protein
VLVTLACSEFPKGHAVWTMQMLADCLGELGILKDITDEAVRLWLKNSLKPWQQAQ